MKESEKELSGNRSVLASSSEAAMRISLLGGEKSHEWTDRTEIRLSKL
jgi:hypothetical protein